MAIRKQRLIHPAIFAKLHLSIVQTARDKIATKSDGREELETGKGAAFYGFYGEANSLTSIHGAMVNDDDVQIYLKEYVRKSKATKRLEILRKQSNLAELSEEMIDGRYLYNRNREARKRLKSIKLSDHYIDLYAVFVGCSSMKNFVETRCKGIPAPIIKEQLELLRVDSRRSTIGPTATFLGYYYSYRDDLIKKFLLEVRYLSGKVVQTGFHYRSSHESDTISEFDIDESSIYQGELSKAGDSGISISLTGKEQGANNIMNILVYTAGRNIKDIELMRGSMQTISAHGYIFFSEVFFVKVVVEEFTQGRLLLSSFDFDKKIADKVLFIKKYLYLQRRTNRIPQSTEQDITKITAKGNALYTLNPLVGVWKIWGLNRKNQVIQSKLIVNNDFSATLDVFTANGIERQVCLFRVSNDRNGTNVWISAHEPVGVELKNIALVEIPTEFSKNNQVTEGAALGVGVKNAKNSLTPMVLTKLDEKDHNFNPTIFKEESGLLTALFSSNGKANHQFAYQLLEKKVDLNNSIEFKTYAQLVQIKLDRDGNNWGG